jgi:hypothetical protein
MKKKPVTLRQLQADFMRLERRLMTRDNVLDVRLAALVTELLDTHKAILTLLKGKT